MCVIDLLVGEPCLFHDCLEYLLLLGLLGRLALRGGCRGGGRGGARGGAPSFELPAACNHLLGPLSHGNKVLDHFVHVAVFGWSVLQVVQ